VAKPSRKAPKSKPVTQHQLFPAVVALWFGALFGFGSIAVRPSLLEELVIKSRIDLLVPAAAPPLGMTARMLVALVMAALGAVIGTAIARRLARPRQEVRERKRTNLSTRDEGASNRSVNPYADASTRNPGPTAGSGSEDAAAPGVLAGRRRSLAIEHEEGYFVPHENAPLPGGAPQIFDIAASGLTDVPPQQAAETEMGSYAEPTSTAAPASVALDWANAAPVLPPVAPIAAAPIAEVIAVQPQVFQADEPAAVAQQELAPAFASAAAHFTTEDQRQVFGAVPPTIPPVDQPRQIFGAPVIDDHVPKEFVEAQGFRTSVFETPQPSPLFPARFEAAPSTPEPAEVSPPYAVPEAFAPRVEAAAPAPVTQPAAPDPALPNPASLEFEDLSSRLAESMRRRRAARAGVPAAATEPVAGIAPEPREAAVPFAVPLAFEPPISTPLAAPEPAADAAPAFTVPAFVVPTLTVPDTATEAPDASQWIPAGLRPLDLNGFEEDDSPEQDSLLPPRRIAFPVEVAPAAFAPPFAVPSAHEPEVTEEVAVAEESYASLLGVTPSPAIARNPFIRVEDPEMDTAAVEPVVIFPGQAMPAANPFTAPFPVGAEESTQFRRFDAPASAGHGQPIAANEAANAVPREEAELALRSALANLQRMSGAA
jgi:hypothetical protein